MVTGIAGVLTVIGEHFWLVVIACIEVAVAFICLELLTNEKNTEMTGQAERRSKVWSETFRSLQ